MNLKELKRLFKKHYKKAVQLKEGGAAWDREITKAQRYLKQIQKYS